MQKKPYSSPNFSYLLTHACGPYYKRYVCHYHSFIIHLIFFSFFFFNFNLACLEYETNSDIQDYKFQFRVLFSFWLTLTQPSSWRYFIRQRPFYIIHTTIIVILWGLLFNFGVLFFRFYNELFLSSNFISVDLFDLLKTLWNRINSKVALKMHIFIYFIFFFNW